MPSDEPLFTFREARRSCLFGKEGFSGRGCYRTIAFYRYSIKKRWEGMVREAVREAVSSFYAGQMLLHQWTSFGRKGYCGQIKAQQARTGEKGGVGLEDLVVGLLEVNHENEIKNIGVFMR